MLGNKNSNTQTFYRPVLVRRASDSCSVAKNVFYAFRFGLLAKSVAAEQAPCIGPCCHSNSFS